MRLHDVNAPTRWSYSSAASLWKTLTNLMGRGTPLISVALALSALTPAYSQSSIPWTDPSPHRSSFVVVAQDVRLEVLDWGGTGKPLVLLAGAGNTAHVFDDFAPKLADRYHVYGITRRGFGASQYSGSEYGADRLGDDVAAVIGSLNLNKPVLVGHSLAGEELSSVANRHPEMLAGLIYLEAGYPYAFNNGTGPAMSEFQGRAPQPPSAGETDLASFGAFAKWYARVNGFTFPDAELRKGWDITPEGRVGRRRNPPGGAASIAVGMKNFTIIPVPALAIFAVPHDQGPWVKVSSDPAIRAAADAFRDMEARLTERQAKAFEEGVPTAHVVRLAGANHYVFLSHEADVLREMRSFLGSLQ